jgi:vesicle-associated membrane protein 7
MADDAAGRRLPFAFLDALQAKFSAFSPPTSSSSTPSHSSYASFTPTLTSLLTEYNTNPPPDALTNAQNNLAQVKDIMVHNVEQILSRGERIELLVDKTDTMAGQAWAFRRGARTVRRQQFWRNQRIMILSVAVGIVSAIYMLFLRYSSLLSSSSISSSPTFVVSA